MFVNRTNYKIIAILIQYHLLSQIFLIIYPSSFLFSSLNYPVSTNALYGIYYGSGTKESQKETTSAIQSNVSIIQSMRI